MSDSSSSSEFDKTSHWPEERRLKMNSEDESSDNEQDEPQEAEGASAPTVRLPRLTAGMRADRTKNPPFIDMMVEAIQEIGDKRKGASAPAMKANMRARHNILEASMKTHFKRQLEKALKSGVLFRPPSHKDSKGVTGRFKVNPDYLKERATKGKVLSKKKAPKVKSIEKRSAVPKVGTKKRPAVPKVDTKKLSSLKQTSAAAKVAKDKIKKARKSIGLTQGKPKAIRKKVSPSIDKKSQVIGATQKKAKTARKKTARSVDKHTVADPEPEKPRRKRASPSKKGAAKSKK